MRPLESKEVQEAKERAEAIIARHWQQQEEKDALERKRRQAEEAEEEEASKKKRKLEEDKPKRAWANQAQRPQRS